MEVPWETEAAGDQVRRSSRLRRSKGRPSRSRRREEKLLLSRTDKEKPAEEKNNPPPPAREKEEKGEEEGRLLDEDEAAQDWMLSFRRGWEECFADLYGSFEDNRFISAVDRPIPCSCIYRSSSVRSSAKSKGRNRV